MLFIFCGVVLLGVDSVMVLKVWWMVVWDCLVKDFDVLVLESVIVGEVGFVDVVVVVIDFLEGKICGWLVVDVNN